MMTPGSTQSWAPNLAKVPSRLEVAQPLPELNDNDKTLSPMLENVTEVEDRSATFVAWDVDDVRTNEEQAILYVVPMPDYMQVHVNTLPRVLIADFTYG